MITTYQASSSPNSCWCPVHQSRRQREKCGCGSEHDGICSKHVVAKPRRHECQILPCKLYESHIRPVPLLYDMHRPTQSLQELTMPAVPSLNTILRSCLISWNDGMCFQVWVGNTRYAQTASAANAVFQNIPSDKGGVLLSMSRYLSLRRR